jgi:putative SOS response-associated peptidase YedK
VLARAGLGTYTRALRSRIMGPEDALHCRASNLKVLANMCGRFTLKTPAAEIARQLELPFAGELAPRFNIAPSQLVAAVRGGEGVVGREVAMLVWGLIPPWTKDPSIGARPINARAETAPRLPTFRHAFLHRRCLVVADGFYEWRRVGRRKQPFYIRLQNGAPFAMAGLWERWQPGPQQVDSCTILTTTANSLVAALHNRMPVILQPADYDRWLDPRVTSPEAIEPLLAPYPSQAMETVAVSDWVNVASHEGPRCLAPAPQQIEQQRSLDFDRADGSDNVSPE